MGQKAKVLVVGRRADMLLRITKLLRSHRYDAIGTMTNEEALQKFKDENPQAVKIGGGVDGDSRALFHQQFSATTTVNDAHPQTVLADLNVVFPEEDCYCFSCDSSILDPIAGRFCGNAANCHNTQD